MIPAAFRERMHAILGADFPDFMEALASPSQHALRVVTKKMSAERLLSLLPFSPEPLPFAAGGFLIPEGERPGAHPLHHAGAFYMQDPSAMATVAALPFDITGRRVLDLCAAPGGKSGQLSERIGKSGLLVSNEIVASRARILLGNLERMGVENAVVTSTDPATLASALPEFFDLVLVDAPCSGEGMFRKYPEAVNEWSPEGVAAAAERGRLILNEAAKTVSPGGYLLYSTCTFAEEENEDNVVGFLAAHPEFSIVPVAEAVCRVTEPGIERIGRPAAITETRRFYPHKAPGEGQYLALLRKEGAQRSGAQDRPARGASMKAKPPQARDGGRDEAALRAALEELLSDAGALTPALFGDTWYALPPILPFLPHGILRAGVALGSFSGRVFIPHHHAFTALGDRFLCRLSLSLGDPRVAAYLRGEEIASDGGRGFAALRIEGAPTGGVKLSGGVAKNHYPKGLRTP